MVDRSASELMSEEDAINKLEGAELKASSRVGESPTSGSGLASESKSGESKSGEAKGKGKSKAVREREEALRKLEEAEARIRELEEEKRAREAIGLAVKHEKMPFAGDNNEGWEIEVGPSPKIADKHPHLKTVTVRAVDESEAIRWYCATNEDKPGSGKMIDPMRIRVVARCVDPGRERLVVHKHRVANVRRKLESGQSLSQKDQEFLERHESEILRLPDL